MTCDAAGGSPGSEKQPLGGHKVYWDSEAQEPFPQSCQFPNENSTRPVSFNTQQGKKTCTNTDSCLFPTETKSRACLISDVAQGFESGCPRSLSDALTTTVLRAEQRQFARQHQTEAPLLKDHF